MKRVIFVLIILLLFSEVLFAVSYTALFSLYGGPGFTKVKGDDLLRTSYTLTFEAEAAGISFGRNTLSLPLSVTFFSDSPPYGYYMLNSHFDLALGLAYRYAFSSLFTLKAGGGITYRIYHDIDASAIAFYTSVSGEFYPAQYTAIIIPVNLFFTKDEIAFNIGIGCLLRIGGGK